MNLHNDFVLCQLNLFLFLHFHRTWQGHSLMSFNIFSSILDFILLRSVPKNNKRVVQTLKDDTDDVAGIRSRPFRKYFCFSQAFLVCLWAGSTTLSPSYVVIITADEIHNLKVGQTTIWRKQIIFKKKYIQTNFGKVQNESLHFPERKTKTITVAK